jgi:hypothetical protein
MNSVLACKIALTINKIDSFHDTLWLSPTRPHSRMRRRAGE